ncbi:MAG: hypothetical protein Q9170_005288 [Blastenia crenularia]
MLLMMAQLPPSEAAELVIHTWYSARITEAMRAAINEYVTKAVEDVVRKVKDKSNDALQSKNWVFGKTEITIRLSKQQWNTVYDILNFKHELKRSEEQRRAVALAPERRDYRERVLAPFGTTLFDHKTSGWLQKDSASPLEGWSLPSVSTPENVTLTAKEDINGQLYFHVRNSLEKFCNRIQKGLVKARFVVYCVDAAVLPKIPNALVSQNSNGKLDRIEVSNIADEAYLGIRKVLILYGHLLKPPDVNRHACLITLFLNACKITGMMMGNDRNELVARARQRQVFKYKRNTFDLRKVSDFRSPLMYRFLAGMSLVRDHDMIFQTYMDSCGFLPAADQAGLKMKKKNTVVEAWPMRLKKRPGENGAEDEFDRLTASSCSGAEHYVEWTGRE